MVIGICLRRHKTMHYEHWIEYLEYVRSYERKYGFETPTERIKTFKEMFGYEITKSLEEFTK